MHHVFMAKSKAYQLEIEVIKLLKEVRISKDISYGELSRLTGLHRTGISLIERGERHPTLLVCLKISEALNISLSDLIKKASK